MKYIAFCEKNYTGGAIVESGTRTLYCIFTVDLHTKHSLKQTAVEYIYTDALLSGAGKYTREQFINEVNLLGASILVNVVDSKLTISIKSTAKNARKTLKLFEMMMQKPTFAKKEISRIQTQISNELIEYKENARGLAKDNFVNSLYPKTDRRFAEKTKHICKILKTITATDLKLLHKQARRGYWTATVGGPQGIINAVKTSVRSVITNSSNSEISPAHSHNKTQSRILLHSVPSKQNIEFSIGTSLPLTLHHPDYLPFVFGLSVLGKWGGFTGRLMSTVREKEGLTYTIYARAETVSVVEQGHWRIMTFFAPDKSVQGLNSTLREIKKIHKHGVTKDEFDRFKVILETQQILLADSLIQSIQELHGYFTAGFSLNEIKIFRSHLLSVKQKEVNAALKKYLNPEKIVISGAGPIKDVRKKIEAICIS